MSKQDIDQRGLFPALDKVIALYFKNEPNSFVQAEKYLI